jgi:hypothetical protein
MRVPIFLQYVKFALLVLHALLKSLILFLVNQANIQLQELLYAKLQAQVHLSAGNQLLQ